MTLQNRVDPWGNLIANPSKHALLMGNRGVLHNTEKHIVRKWKLKAWIICLTQFNDNKRVIFSPQRYSELFFLDEATAFAAGHRPCAECQRQRSQQFKTMWIKTNTSENKMKLSQIDAQLQLERIVENDHKITFQTSLMDLPIGSCFEYANQAVMIVAKHCYLIWSFDGYEKPIDIDDESIVKVLTPHSIVETFKQGLVPHFHPSAQKIIL
ncbi:hypothetical protein [uncultured Acinetobacter sp.]|uniref:hypothetical protein n=1 Tax=uncultured Acinetobacter sp. TaxID=165433 RepID=UPI0025E010F0|nr:hypothetical protein [uncultured Acinetobacter sp.]